MSVSKLDINVAWNRKGSSQYILVTVRPLESLHKILQAQYVYIAVGSKGIIQKLFTLLASDTVYW